MSNIYGKGSNYYIPLNCESLISQRYYFSVPLESKGLSLNLITIFTIRPAIRLRQTRIIRQEEKKVAMKIKGLFKLNEMARINMPKIKKNMSRSEDKQIPHHQ